MRLSAKERDLGTAEHAGSHGNDADTSLARELGAAVAAIKRELAAILVVAAIGAPVVLAWLEGLQEVVVLAGYGLGALLWIHARVRGLRLAARRARPPDGGDGP